MKARRSKFLLRLAAIALAVYAVTNILSIQLEIGQAEADIALLEQQIDQQRMENALLEERLKNEMDIEAIKDAARSELGMVEPGEEVFVDVSD